MEVLQGYGPAASLAVCEGWPFPACGPMRQQVPVRQRCPPAVAGSTDTSSAEQREACWQGAALPRCWVVDFTAFGCASSHILQPGSP